MGKTSVIIVVFRTSPCQNSTGFNIVGCRCHGTRGIFPGFIRKYGFESNEFLCASVLRFPAAVPARSATG